MKTLRLSGKMVTVLTMRCIDNSGDYYLCDDSTQPMSNFLTIGKEYTGKLDEDGNFTTIDNARETSVFDAERFCYVF